MLISIAIVLVGVIGFFSGRLVQNRKRAQPDAEMSAAPLGVSVEVDCRACGKHNRVPFERARDRPKCGRCKVALMPNKHLVICRLRSISEALDRELNAVWRDEAQFWPTLANHILLDSRAKENAENPAAQVVN